MSISIFACRRSIFQALRRFWIINAPLTLVGIFTFGLLLLMLPGLLLDERVITGAPAWLKPASLRSQLQCIRSLLYGCWACSNNIGDWLVWLQMPRLWISCANNNHHSPGSTGTTSHFNFSTPQDEALWFMEIALILLGNFGYGNFTAARAVG